VNKQQGARVVKQFINTFLKASSLFLVMTFFIFSGCQQQKDYSKELKPLFDKYYEVWKGGNVDELDAIFSPDYVRHSDEGSSAKSLDELKKVITEFKDTFSDIEVLSEEEIYTENKIAGRWSVSATHTATGKSIKQWGVNIIHFKDGKIVEEWDAFDNLSFIEQLGYTITPPSGMN
jgi:ketosteroid isomerase-like protein